MLRKSSGMTETEKEQRYLFKFYIHYSYTVEEKRNLNNTVRLFEFKVLGEDTEPESDMDLRSPKSEIERLERLNHDELLLEDQNMFFHRD